MVTDAYSVREGLGEAAAFYRSHPLLNFSYFAIVIGVTMFAMHPVFLLSSFFYGMVLFYPVKGHKGNSI